MDDASISLPSPMSKRDRFVSVDLLQIRDSIHPYLGNLTYYINCNMLTCLHEFLRSQHSTVMES